MSKKQKRPRGPGSYSGRNQLVRGRKAKRNFCGGKFLKILKHILRKKQGG